MPKFRKKPITIEAVKFNGENTKEILLFAHRGLPPEANTIVSPYMDYLRVRTREGEMRADVGDWIVRGVKGEIYPCKPDIFEATYEPVGKGV